VIPGGRVSLGASEKTVAETGFVWDNELPQIHRNVSTFQVSSHCITNAEFREFVEDGGYQNDAFWDSPEAASWAKSGPGYPLRWESSTVDPVGQWIVHTPLDGPVYFQDASQWPAHVTLAEALAYCKWLGGGSRLLTEAEYHRIFFHAAEISRDAPAAAFRKSAIAGNNNFKFRTPTPIAALNDEPVSSVPVFDLCGNGWEWTTTVFAPLDQGLFNPLQAYPQYSVDFFDGKHFVCLGGSMFTNLHTIRPSFRNFYQSRYPYGIHKFRVVAP
jgi:gamma-glutamyl hercynylcysteine S-oxide synthase